MIDAAFDAWMLYPGWMAESSRSAVSLERVVDHIDHIWQPAGNGEHAATTRDLDGGFGTERSLHGLDTMADLQKILALFRRRGYKESDVEGFMHFNWVRFFQHAWRGRYRIWL